jgi:fibronectin-binding autotransporter adhesin
MKTSHSTIEILEDRIAPAVIVVTTLSDSPVAGKTTLRQALQMADNDLGMHPGKVNTITFKLPAAAAGSENVILLTGGVLTSMGDVNIIGPGASKLIIDGNKLDGVFNITDTVATTDSPVTMSGLTIIDGKLAGGNAGGQSGGAGIHSTESLTLKNMVVSGNTVTGTQSGTCGIVIEGNDTAGTKFSMSNSLVSGNSGVGGGGVGLYTVKTFSVVNTIITGNTVSEGSGGGLYAGLASSGTGGTIAGCVISGNIASDYGGGLQLDSPAAAKITISGTKITGNTARGGAGMVSDGGKLVITGSTIENNTATYKGGGIYESDFVSLTISKSTFAGNKTAKVNAAGQGGGGIFVSGTGSSTPLPVTITSSHFSDNSSASLGGGILAKNGIALSVTGSTFAGNNASNANGGGIETMGNSANNVNLTVNGSTFIDNSAQIGAGISSEGNTSGNEGGGTFSMTGSKLTGNFASNTGGGVYLNTSGAITIKNAVVADNIGAVVGGGMAICQSIHVLISGGLVTGNFAQDGGGILLDNADGTIQGVTITGNAASQTGGGVDGLGLIAVLLNHDTIFGNSAVTGPDVSGL